MGCIGTHKFLVIAPPPGLLRPRKTARLKHIYPHTDWHWP
jgi:hypothetical protein